MDYRETNSLMAKCIRERFTDKAYGIELPAYVREELIATLKGE